MTRTQRATTIGGVLLATALAWADGGYFVDIQQTGDLAQTRQEVVLAFHPTSATDGAAQTTYVLRSLYSGDVDAFAWVIPVPATPTNVVAHDDEAIFTSLSALTAPVFMIVDPHAGGNGLSCACAGAGAALNQAGDSRGLVTVEAEGSAGIFDWAALTSTGGTALLTWLDDNGFSVPAAADTILDQYVQADWHFLALRITEPASVTAGADGQLAIPPIQFTCQTERRVYPMVISQVSAADETEVIIYVLADHRAAASNVTNATINRDDVVYDASSESSTNYESLFRETLAAQAGPLLVTESADSYYAPGLNWPDAPTPAGSLSYLTRLRTVLTPAQMSVDFEFEDAAADTTVFHYFEVEIPQIAQNTAAVATPLAWTAAAALTCGFMKRGFRRRG